MNKYIDKNQHVVRIITDVFSCQKKEIESIVTIKKGMSNHSYLFSVWSKKYILRVPGEGTNKLISRAHEAQSYKTIEPYHICEKPVYINEQNGYKITRFIENVRVCDPFDFEQVRQCMQKLKKFHALNLQTDYEFDLFKTILYYESLCGENPSYYKDYEQVKKNIFSLREFIQKHIQRVCFCHIDAVPDNFLFDDARTDELHLQLTDWEYAAMQDPDLDIAMFCIYSMYKKEQIDKTIDLYYENQCPADIRIKIYCYIASCGLLWSNWCEYKFQFGADFGEYALQQYRYAKEYYRLVENLIK